MKVWILVVLICLGAVWGILAYSRTAAKDGNAASPSAAETAQVSEKAILQETTEAERQPASNENDDHEISSTVSAPRNESENSVTTVLRNKLSKFAETKTRKNGEDLLVAVIVAQKDYYQEWTDLPLGEPTTIRREKDTRVITKSGNGVSRLYKVSINEFPEYWNLQEQYEDDEIIAEDLFESIAWQTNRVLELLEQ